MATQMTRRVKYKVKELKEGDFFGHDEYISGTNRKSSVYSFHESKLFYVNIGENTHLFDDIKKQQIMLAFPPTNFDLIGNTIIENFEIKRKYTNCFLSALQLNYVPDSSRDSFQGNEKVKKLRHWLNRAKNNQIGMLYKLISRDYK